MSILNANGNNHIFFDLDKQLGLETFHSVSFEKTKNAPVLPVLRGKGTFAAADNFTFNDYIELKFIIKKDDRYSSDGVAHFKKDKTALSELEKLYKIYAIYRTKVLVFVEAPELFAKFFPGIQHFKLNEIKDLVKSNIDFYTKKLTEAYVKENEYNTNDALEALETYKVSIFEFCSEYCLFTNFSEANTFFGSYVDGNKKTIPVLTEKYFNDNFSKTFKGNLLDSNKFVASPQQAKTPFLTMLSKFAISNIPETSDGFEVTLGLYILDDLYSATVVNHYKSIKNQVNQKNFYDAIETKIRSFFNDKNETFILDVYNYQKEYAEITAEVTNTVSDEANPLIKKRFNDETASVSFSYNDIAQFEIITYNNVAEIPIQNKSRPLKQNLGVSQTNLSLKFYQKDSLDSDFIRNFNSLQYLTELEQRTLRINAVFPFLNALDQWSVELSDFYFANDPETDGAISSLIFSSSGYKYDPNYKNNQLNSLVHFGSGKETTNSSLLLFLTFLSRTYSEVKTDVSKDLDPKERLNFCFDTTTFTLAELANYYYPFCLNSYEYEVLGWTTLFSSLYAETAKLYHENRISEAKSLTTNIKSYDYDYATRWESNDTVYSNIMFVVNSMFPTLNQESSFVAGGTSLDIYKNEFIKVAMADYLLNAPRVLINLVLNNPKNSLFELTKKSLAVFKKRISSDILLEKVLSIFTEDMLNPEVDFFVKTGTETSPSQIKKKLKTVRDELIREMEKSSIFNLKGNSGGNETYQILRGIQLLSGITITKNFNERIFVHPSLNVYKKKTIRKKYLISKDDFPLVIKEFDKFSNLTFAVLAPLCIRFSFSANYLGSSLVNAASKFVYPFIYTDRMINSLPNNFNKSLPKVTKKSLLESWYANAWFLISGEQKTPGSNSFSVLKGLFAQNNTNLKLEDLAFKDVDSYCDVKMAKSEPNPYEAFLDVVNIIDLESLKSKKDDHRKIVSSDTLTQFLASSDAKRDKFLKGVTSIEGLTQKTGIDFLNTFAGYTAQNNVYTSAFIKNEATLYKTGVALADSTSLRLASAIKSDKMFNKQITSMFANDLNKSVPYYSIFILRPNDEKFNSQSQTISVKRIEEMYGVDKVVDVSVQFSEETRSKTAFIDLIDTESEISNFTFDTTKILEASINSLADGAVAKIKANQSGVLVGDSICIYLGYADKQMNVFNGVVHAISTGKIKQLTCINYAAELSHKTFDVYRSVGDLADWKEYWKNLAHPGDEARYQSLCSTKLTCNVNPHITLDGLNLSIDSSTDVDVNFSDPRIYTTVSHEDEDCSVYSLIFRGLAANIDSLKHFRSFDEFIAGGSFQSGNEKNSWLSSIWDRNDTTSFIPKNLIKNINNTDRDLLYYGVAAEGDFSEYVTESKEETADFFSTNKIKSFDGSKSSE